MEKSIHTPLQEAFRKHLARVRQEAGLTQRELAKRLRRVHSVVAHMENGQRRVDFIEFYWFCRACGVDPVKAASKILQDFKAMQKGQRRTR